MARKKRKKLEIAPGIKRFIEERLILEPEKMVRLGVWALGTIACHNLNLAGMITWFGKPGDKIDTGLPYPFKWRTRMPWEKQPKPTAEDKITEWALPAITAWMLVYHPEAVAKFVDAIIPF